jgi:endonuclease-3
MTRKERYAGIVAWFREHVPVAQSELHFADPYQLIVAVVLSAQCTDKRVNMVTPELFRHYPDAQSMAQAEPEDVLEYISSVSYPNSKARHLVELSRMLMERHGGEVPDDMNQLLELPGVGRKTANVMQAVAFGRSALAVDTHVYRVSHRLGLVPKTANTPLKVEQELMKHIPEADIPRAHHWLLLHGRYVCTSRAPHCSRCPLESICPKLLSGSTLP